MPKLETMKQNECQSCEPETKWVPTLAQVGNKETKWMPKLETMKQNKCPSWKLETKWVPKLETMKQNECPSWKPWNKMDAKVGNLKQNECPSWKLWNKMNAKVGNQWNILSANYSHKWVQKVAFCLRECWSRPETTWYGIFSLKYPIWGQLVVGW